MKWAFGVFIVVFGAAVLLLLVGTFGWFGEEQDPLSAVFLLPLGLPWNIMADRLGLAGVASLTLAPVINGGILLRLWKRRSGRFQQ